MVGIGGEWGIQGDLLNKVVRVGHTEKATFEKELKGVWPGLSVDVGERTLHSDIHGKILLRPKEPPTQ